jgi:hypothetical protein
MLNWRMSVRRPRPAIFERWEFTWGGRWLLPEGMHFELFDSPGA